VGLHVQRLTYRTCQLVTRLVTRQPDSKLGNAC
jgi:hypothetical protein